MGGGICALLDGICVTLLYALKGVTALQLWQNVASSILGPQAFRGGWSTGVLGLALHCSVALTAAAVFVLMSGRIPVVLRHYIPAGLLYGVAVFVVMNLIVVPLSAMPKRPLNLSMVTIQVVMHLILVGLPISVVAHRLLPPGE